MNKRMLLILGPVVWVISAFLLLTVSYGEEQVNPVSVKGDETLPLHECLIGCVSGSYTVLPVSDKGINTTDIISTGQLYGKWDSITSFTMADGRQYIFGHDESGNWFIQEVLAVGELVTTSHGALSYYYSILSAFTIPGGKTFIYGQTHLTDDEKDPSFWINMEVKTGGILDVSLVDYGSWTKWYPHALVTNPNSASPVLFAEDYFGNWFLRPISEEGKMQEESNNGQLLQYYDTIQTYNVEDCVYLFGQNKNNMMWNIWTVEDTVALLDEGKWAYYCNVAVPYYINGSPFLYLQQDPESSVGYLVMEIKSDGKMGSRSFLRPRPLFLAQLSR